jgi:DNA-binding transcriptional ArsR family regulator
MSFDLLGWLGAVDGDLNDPEFRVLFRLCWHANQTTGEIYPSIDKLATGTGMHKRTVMRHLKALEDKKYIEVARERWPNGTQKVNRYVVLIDVTYRMPGDREVRVKGEMPVGKPGDSAVTWVEKPGDKSDISRVTVVSPNKEGRVKKEDSPSNFVTVAPEGESEEADTDLFGGNLVIPDLTDQEIGDAYVERWNRLCDEEDRLERASRFSAERQKELVARLGTRTPAEVGVLLDELFRRITRSRVLRGRGRGMDWKPAWSWPLGKKNFNKIMEGFYAEDFDSENPDRGGNGGERSHIQAGRDVLGAIERMYGES